MKYVLCLVAATGAVATGILVGSSNIPLGIPGEWVWNRTSAWPPFGRFIAVVAPLAAYAALLAILVRIVDRHGRWAAFAGLLVVFMGGWWTQSVCLELPMPPAGVERWPVSIASPASSGYYKLARDVDLLKFLAAYEKWIEKADSFHIGTHPPGLIVFHAAFIGLFQSNPNLATKFVGQLPARLLAGTVEATQLTAAAGNRQAVQDAAAISASILVVWFLNLATVFPIYLVARHWSEPAESLFVAGLWPLVPASPMFLPTGDCLYPVIAMTVFAMLLAGVRRSSGACFAVAGLVWSLGLFCSLAFLALLPATFGPVLTMLWARTANSKDRLKVSAATVGEFLCGAMLLPVAFKMAFGTNLFVVWSINLAKHAGFYAAMPRSWLGWGVINLVEFAIVLGPTVVGFILLAVADLRGLVSMPNAPNEVHLRLLSGKWAFVFWLATVLALDVTGRNRSEAARLWIFLTPLACASISWTLRPAFRSFAVLWLLVVFQGAALLLLIARVEPLLPVAL